MESDTEESNYKLPPRPTDIITKLTLFQADLIYKTIAFLFSPILTLLSLATESYHRAEETKDTVETAVQKVPSTFTRGGVVLLKRLSYGFLGAAYMCMVMVVLSVVAGVVGFGLVQLVVEEPVVFRERLHFDYTQKHPTAVFSQVGRFGSSVKKRHLGIPVGHTFNVSLLLLMPESDFNRGIGVFQVSAELFSTEGNMLARSSQPCMLRFRSEPIRLTRTVLMGVPLVLGISSETQNIAIEILNHKEVKNPRSGSIGVTLIPRAGTSNLPQIYEAEILINAHLPWTKNLVHKWRWTCYIWTSLYLYMMFLGILICCWKPFFFVTMAPDRDRSLLSREEPEEEISIARHEESSQEFLRKLKKIRNKRKAMFLQGDLPENVGSCASSISVTKDDYGSGVEEEVGCSESVFLEGSF